MKHEETPPRLALGIFISLFAYVFFVTASSLVASFNGSFPVVQILFVQNIVSLVFLTPFFFVKKFPGFKTKVWSIHLIRDCSGVFSYYLFFVAIKFLDLVNATVLNYTAPFFVPFFWWMWMKEKVGRNVWWSIIVGFIGVGVILNPSREIFQLGFVLGIFAGLLSALAMCAVRILSVHKEPTRRTLFYYFSVGSLLSFPFALIYWVPPSDTQWLKMILIGVATASGQIFLTIAYRYGTASYLSPLGYSSVIYAGLVSYFLFDNPLVLRTLIGGILIILGGSATYILKKKPRSVAETFEHPNPKEKPPL
ncbi:MAG TPA: DMT family transporter [Chlamydiales bacterium]|nr:DMT family transporter [Chlamydiales bacterium]